ncbi:MAG: 2-oxoglutarate and iron-dependent oxygenase domain-containing protein [Bacteroidia bacterium]
MQTPLTHVPVIDISPLVAGQGDRNSVAKQLHAACRESGFFYIRGHGIDETLQNRLHQLSEQFFALPLEEKMNIHMKLGGRAWRGFFPVGEELTSGKPDRKEGLYFGTELGPEDPRVRAKLPMHGANLFPGHPSGLRETVLSYTSAMTTLGHQLMEGLALSLGLPESYFSDRYTSDPLTLFRIFHYPPESKEDAAAMPWGVGEHTDYGVLTILKQDTVGGLQVRSHGQWIEAPYIEGTFICNIGDMLDRMTGGYYRSTPHRVRNTSGRERYSFPFFFDPNFDVEVKPIDLRHIAALSDEPEARWDGENVHTFEGTYGDYVLGKVAKVFPQLRRDVG